MTPENRVTSTSQLPYQQQFSLEGRTALVTGSSTGLGKAMAMSLGAAGAKVAINYSNNTARAERAFEEFEQAGFEGALVRGSVVEETEVGSIFRQVEDALGPVDIVVVNATPAQPQKSIEAYDWAFYQEMLDFFVKSPFLLARRALPHMKERRWGRFINIGSEVVHRGVGNFSAYVAAKGAQDGWTRSMASELAPFNITVNIVCPGWIPVERHEDDPKDVKDSYRSLIPMDRWGVPEDVGGAVTFLASDAASFITGQNIHVNGGMTVG
jgi:3-oxoacyl-[acyl-carrier protein] reductase